MRISDWSSDVCSSDLTKAPYAARNGGGYTLEAELGITPNGYAEPDFMGWEIKQYGVRDFVSFRPKYPVTLMTPEPTGGVYRTEGVAAFMRRFGYTDQDRKNVEKGKSVSVRVELGGGRSNK